MYPRNPTPIARPQSRSDMGALAKVLFMNGA